MDGGGNLNLYVNVERSFMDIASGSINKDVTNVVAGFMIVFVYVALMLGKFDKVFLFSLASSRALPRDPEGDILKFLSANVRWQTSGQQMSFPS